MIDWESGIFVSCPPEVAAFSHAPSPNLLRKRSVHAPELLMRMMRRNLIRGAAAGRLVGTHAPPPCPNFTREPPPLVDTVTSRLLQSHCH